MTKQATTYGVTTLRKDGTLRKKMLYLIEDYSLDYEHGYQFTDKKVAFARRDEENAKDWTGYAAGEWVVINMKTMKVVTR